MVVVEREPPSDQDWQCKGPRLALWKYLRVRVKVRVAIKVTNHLCPGKVAPGASELRNAGPGGS